VRPLRVLLGLIGAVTVILAIEAIYLWQRGDESGSLAMATAVATFALAFGATLTIDQNRGLLRAASDEAKASRETVEEMQRQRELAYRSWLIISRIAGERFDTYRTKPPAYRVSNIGSGPAVAVALSAVRKQAEAAPTWTWISSETQGIDAGGHWDVPAVFVETSQVQYDPHPDRYRCVTDDLIAAEREGEIVAVRYEDLFGVHNRSSPDASRALRPEEWRGAPTLRDAPDWLRCHAA
jgi:hypothetical protein